MRKKFLLSLLPLLTCLFWTSTTFALTNEDYKGMGLLPFKGKPYYTLEKLDKLSRPTSAHIQFHTFREATADEWYADPQTPINGKTGHRTDYLPGYRETPNYVFEELEEGRQSNYPAWSPNPLLSTSWTDSRAANKAMNYALFTTYSFKGYWSPHQDDEKLDTVKEYEEALNDWLQDATNKAYLIDYKISLLYEGEELVPRKIKLTYVGLTEEGELKKINLAGNETFDSHGIATVVLDNTAPNVTINYLTGETTGQVYVPRKSIDESSSSSELDERDEIIVYADLANGYYYYDYELTPEELNSYKAMSLYEAEDEHGYLWGVK